MERYKKFGVGILEPGSYVYVHKKFVSMLPMKIRLMITEMTEVLKKHLAKDQVGIKWTDVEPDFNLIQVPLQGYHVIFMKSNDFNEASEPSIHEHVMVNKKGVNKYTIFNDGEFVLLHKWAMVTDTYPGFNVLAAKARSEKIMQLDNVNAKIVKQEGSSWRSNVEPLLLPTNQV